MTALKSVQFTNYKAFVNEQLLEIRPITLLFGENSVGKSAALRLLPILSKSANDHQSPTTIPSILDYAARALRGSNFLELTSRKTATAALGFNLDWNDLSYRFTIKQLNQPRSEYVAEFLLTHNDISLHAVNTDPARRLFNIDHLELHSDVSCTFHGLFPQFDNMLPEQATLALTMLKNRLALFSQNVHWIAAVRSQPPRLFTIEPGTNTRISDDGSGVAETLRESFISNDGVADRVSSWLNRACRCSLSFAATDAQVFQGREWFPFNVQPDATNASVPVQDVGEGVAQSLPVVTLCHQAATGRLGDSPILALEQPELHLHPKAASLLADTIVDCVASGSTAKHVIETHSESFLLALQVALLERRLNKDQLLVYWVEVTADGSSLRRIEFDEEGYPSEGWPEGVFRESLEQARRISELRLR